MFSKLEVITQLGNSKPQTGHRAESRGLMKRKRMKKSYSNFGIYLILAALTLLLTSCNKTPSYSIPEDFEQATLQKVEYPEAKFIVFSDPHFYDLSLGSSGSAFQEELDTDRKLLVESSEIIAETVGNIKKQDVDFVLISGDLTKDGEEINHLKFQKLLDGIEATGKSVYVIPGNHDVNNLKAIRYDGAQKERVANVSAEKFAEIYKNQGYGEAIARDENSLSYFAEMKPGLWLMALDSCRWKENTSEHTIHGGAFSDKTLNWIETMLIRAKKENKAVIGMMHHGAVPHFPEQEETFSDYVVKDYNKATSMFAALGVKMVFTGHYHSQDITRFNAQEGNSKLYDIETGSLITFPNPYRKVKITSDQKLHLSVRVVPGISSYPDGFRGYSKNFTLTHTAKAVDRALQDFWVSDEDRVKVKMQIAKGYVTHLQGDEQKPESVVNTDGLNLWGKFILNVKGDLIESWYTDLPPADNEVVLDL